MIVNSWKRCSIGLLVLLNETTDQQHRCLLSFLNLAAKPSVIVEETVAFHSHIRVLTVWLVFPPYLFVIFPSPPIQLMATHFVSCLPESILTSTPSILVPASVKSLPCIHSATVSYFPHRPTPSTGNHTPIPAVMGGNP